MKKDQWALLKVLREKARDAIFLVEHSLRYISPYDSQMQYGPKEREPYDALSDRFVRSVEICLKFFRSYERYLYAENSDTLRDLLNRMEKAGIVSSVRLWMEMRELRNRMGHGYLPDEIEQMYDLIMDEFGHELLKVSQNIKQIDE